MSDPEMIPKPYTIRNNYIGIYPILLVYFYLTDILIVSMKSSLCIKQLLESLKAKLCHILTLLSICLLLLHFKFILYCWILCHHKFFSVTRYVRNWYSTLFSYTATLILRMIKLEETQKIPCPSLAIYR